MSRIKVGLIGFGNLGKEISIHLLKMSHIVSVIGALEQYEVKQKPSFPVFNNIGDLLLLKPDVIVECASQEALKNNALIVLNNGIDLVPASVGVLSDDKFCKELIDASVKSGAMIRMPSGAIAGIDGLAAAKHSGINKVLYRGTMSPNALHGICDEKFIKKTVFFEGSAREAVSKFPRHANLTAVISLCGVGFDKTRVEFIVDPEATRNIHELHVQGNFGEFDIRVQGELVSSSSPSTRIVAGSLAQAAIKSNYTLLNCNY